MSTAALDLPAGPGRGALLAGWALSGVAILFFAMDGGMKLAYLPVVAETTAQLGWPADPATIYLLAALLLGSTLLYAVRRTALLGAISPLFSHILFGVYLGLFVWGGLWLRDPRVRALLPLVR
jgi:hypothetical protein